MMETRCIHLLRRVTSLDVTDIYNSALPKGNRSQKRDFSINTPYQVVLTKFPFP